MCKSTYCIFERVFGGDIVQFFNSEGGEIQTTAMTLLNIPLVIILLIGCKKKKIFDINITGPTNSIPVTGEMYNSKQNSKNSDYFQMLQSTNGS